VLLTSSSAWSVLSVTPVNPDALNNGCRWMVLIEAMGHSCCSGVWFFFFGVLSITPVFPDVVLLLLLLLLFA
jgi:hypothetical protein